MTPEERSIRLTGIVASILNIDPDKDTWHKSNLNAVQLEIAAQIEEAVSVANLDHHCARCQEAHSKPPYQCMNCISIGFFVARELAKGIIRRRWERLRLTPTILQVELLQLEAVEEDLATMEPKEK